MAECDPSIAVFSAQDISGQSTQHEGYRRLHHKRVEDCNGCYRPDVTDPLTQVTHSPRLLTLQGQLQDQRAYLTLAALLTYEDLATADSA